MPGAKILMATVRRRRVSSPRNTCPMPPCPSGARSLYGPKEVPGATGIRRFYYIEWTGGAIDVIVRRYRRNQSSSGRAVARRLLAFVLGEQLHHQWQLLRPV